jgi:hypothetical protein
LTFSAPFVIIKVQRNKENKLLKENRKMKKDFTAENFVRTIDFGDVQIRRNYTEGIRITEIELSDGTWAVIKTDYKTNQPFAVILTEEELFG